MQSYSLYWFPINMLQNVSQVFISTIRNNFTDIKDTSQTIPTQRINLFVTDVFDFANRFTLRYYLTILYYTV